VASASSMQGTLPRTNGSVPAGARLAPPGQAHLVAPRQVPATSMSSSPAAGWTRVKEPVIVREPVKVKEPVTVVRHPTRSPAARPAAVVRPTTPVARPVTPVRPTTPVTRRLPQTPAQQVEPMGIGMADAGVNGNWILLVLQSPNVLQQYAKAIFRQADTDGSGSLSLEELQSIIPVLHAQLGFNIKDDPEDALLARSRMRRFDKNMDGSLSEEEFDELYRWTLWRKYEDICPPSVRRADILTAETRLGDATPNRYYTIGEKLGEGQFGAVNKVFERRTGAERVLKTINRQKAVQSGTPLNLLMQEIQLLAMLDHPHILRLFEFYQDAVNVYLVTDILYGGHLLEIVEQHARQQKPLPEAWVARVFRQTLEAIAYCHGKGVMHKDIKFENLMLRTPVTVHSPIDEIHTVVIDMGLSELFGPQHGKSFRSNQIAGSMATIAPEVLCQDFSYKCDIWSLGCLLFAIFNVTPKYVPDGRGGKVLYTYPFDPEPTREDPRGIQGMWRNQKAGAPMERIASVSAEARYVVERMLTFEERNRPDARQCLDMPWLNIAQSDVVVHLSGDQVDTLMQEHNARLWWRTAMAKAATQLPAGKIMELSDLFKSIDTGNEGYIEKAELSAALQKLGVEKSDADSAADAVDIDSSGRIEWTEFVAALIPASQELLATSLQIVFQNFDLDGDGYIVREEIVALLNSGQIDSMVLPAANSALPTEQKAEMMVKELDPEGRGISFTQFHDYFLGNAYPEAVDLRVD